MYERKYEFKARGKQRPRATRNGRMYTPKQTVEFEKMVAMGWGYPRLSKEIRTEVDVYVKIPTSFTKGKRLAAEHNIIRPTTTPDIDNILKAIFDGLNGVAYEDDKQIVEVVANKYYSDRNYFVVRVEELKREKA